MTIIIECIHNLYYIAIVFSVLKLWDHYHLFLACMNNISKHYESAISYCKILNVELTVVSIVFKFLPTI